MVPYYSPASGPVFQPDRELLIVHSLSRRSRDGGAAAASPTKLPGEQQLAAAGIPAQGSGVPGRVAVPAPSHHEALQQQRQAYSRGGGMAVAAADACKAGRMPAELAPPLGLDAGMDVDPKLDQGSGCSSSSTPQLTPREAAGPSSSSSSSSAGALPSSVEEGDWPQQSKCDKSEVQDCPSAVPAEAGPNAGIPAQAESSSSPVRDSDGGKLDGDRLILISSHAAGTAPATPCPPDDDCMQASTLPLATGIHPSIDLMFESARRTLTQRLQTCGAEPGGSSGAEEPPSDGQQRQVGGAGSSSGSQALNDDGDDDRRSGAACLESGPATTSLPVPAARALVPKKSPSLRSHGAKRKGRQRNRHVPGTGTRAALDQDPDPDSDSLGKAKQRPGSDVSRTKPSPAVQLHAQSLQHAQAVSPRRKSDNQGGAPLPRLLLQPAAVPPALQARGSPRHAGHNNSGNNSGSPAHLVHSQGGPGPRAPTTIREPSPMRSRSRLVPQARSSSGSGAGEPAAGSVGMSAAASSGLPPHALVGTSPARFASIAALTSRSSATASSVHMPSHALPHAASIPFSSLSQGLQAASASLSNSLLAATASCSPRSTESSSRPLALVFDPHLAQQHHLPSSLSSTSASSTASSASYGAALRSYCLSDPPWPSVEEPATPPPKTTVLLTQAALQASTRPPINHPPASMCDGTPSPSVPAANDPVAVAAAARVLPSLASCSSPSPDISSPASQFLNFVHQAKAKLADTHQQQQEGGYCYSPLGSAPGPIPGILGDLTQLSLPLPAPSTMAYRRSSSRMRGGGGGSMEGRGHACCEGAPGAGTVRVAVGAPSRAVAYLR